MKVCWAFFFFLWKLMIFFRQVLLFLVGNDRNWSLLRCITLNARVYSVTLVVTSTGNGKTLPISLTYPKGLLKTSSEEWSMILHTTSDDFVISKHKRLKGNGKTSNWSFSFAIWSCSTFPRVRQSSKYKNDKAIGLFCWYTLIALSDCLLKVER